MAIDTSSVRRTLPARYYTDPTLFDEELERFFCQTWIAAGRSDQVVTPGQYFLRQIGHESIIIVRDLAGEIRAFFNVCRHRGTRMCTEPEGSFSTSIQCPYHAWTYGLDGQLIGAPHMGEAGFRKEDYPLHSVNVSLWDGHIFINLADRPQPLSSQLADLPQRFESWRMHELRFVKRIEYGVGANWKLIVQNYNECLHCPILHPTLNRLHSYRGTDDEQPHPTYVGGFMAFRPGVETMSLDGKRRREYLPGLDEHGRRHVAYYAVYPNLLLSLHPDYVMTHTLWPRAVDRTEIVCEWLFHPDELAKPGFDPSDAIDFWDMTNKEDWGISELSQLGIRSRAYTPGPYSAREGLPYAFDQMVLERERQAHEERGARKGEV